VREQERATSRLSRNGRAEESREFEEPPVRRRGEGCGAEAAALRKRGEEVRKRERPVEGEGDRLDSDENMEKRSMGYYYCQ
jgi:hypothetical protein